MAAEIRLFLDEERTESVGEIELADVQLPLQEKISTGEPVRIYGRNTGSTTLKDFSIGADGDGKSAVQFAVDRDGDPGVWASPGEEILIADFIGPREDFTFWARGIFIEEDREGDHEFDFLFRGTSVG
jgi:hypothetical protein